MSLGAVTPLDLRTASMRQALLRNLVLLTLLTAGTILAVTLVSAYRSVQDLSRSLIASANAQTESRLRRIFDPLADTLAVSRGWAEDGVIDLADGPSLNALFIPVMENLPAVSSVLIATPRGEEFMLLKSGDTWWNRRTKVEEWGKRTHWTAWKDSRTKVKEEWRELNYDPRTRPWFQGAMAQAGRGTPSTFWTEPYVFFTTKEPGITVATTVTSRQGDTLVIALDLLLMDISRFTSQLPVRQHGIAAVLTPEGRVLGVPRHEHFQDAKALKQAVLSPAADLGIEPLSDAVSRWRAAGSEQEQIFSFKSQGEGWWAGFEPFDLSPQRRLWIGVAVPETDFLQQVKRERDRMLLVTLGAVLLAVLMALLMDRAFRRKVHQAVQAARQLGQYNLQEEIGTGAMGSVYRAQHAMLRRPTAIKLLRPDQVENEAAMARFEREARLTSRLNHPHTIAIYDYGKTPDGVFYYAMEYLVAVDLQTLVRQTGPMVPARMTYVLRQVCGSLQEAHGIGLIHRDIKPSNIMLTERAGDPDFVKVLDFGLVKDLGSAEEAELTTANSLTGTPLYLSPEAIGDPRSVGAASDIYGLGAVAYFLLTGRPVFTGQTLVEVCAKHLHETPRPPSERLGQPLPGDVETVVLACLAKEPAERPKGVGELSAMLARCEDSSRWGPVQARHWWQHHADLRPRQSERRPQAPAAPLAVDLKSRNR
jgi:serine/threonine protein kinase